MGTVRKESLPERLAEHHRFEALGQRVLLNVATSLFYQVNNVVFDLVGLCETLSVAGAVGRMRRRYKGAAIEEALDYLEKAGFFSKNGGAEMRPPARHYPLRNLELILTHACNLACRYCYGSPSPGDNGGGGPLLYGAKLAHMPEPVALAGVDYLFAHAGNLKHINLIFFGGEPFLNLPVMKKVTAYCREREKTTGKKVDLSVVTNGTHLRDDVIRFVNEQRISVQISIDGPPAIHDRNRPQRGGAGSYDAMMPGVRALLAARPGRVPARATASAGAMDNLAVLKHLVGLGFKSVHVEPSLHDSGSGTFTPADIEEMLRQEDAVAAFFLERIRAGEYFNYHTLVRHVRDTRVVREKRRFYCGAGRGLLTLSSEGAFYPCHRFVGNPDYCLGTLEAGIDESKRAPFRALHVDARPECRACWARYFCGGGCWKHAQEANGGLKAPDSAYACRLTRRQVELAMAINAELDVSDKEILNGIFESATLPYLKG